MEDCGSTPLERLLGRALCHVVHAELQHAQPAAGASELMSVWEWSQRSECSPRSIQHVGLTWDPLDKRDRARTWSHVGDDRGASSSADSTEWGVYSEAQDAAIEIAFLAGLEHVEVEVGIRRYLIVFESHDTSTNVFLAVRQVDVEHGNSARRVRRRRVAVEERCRLLRPASRRIARGEDACPICMLDFSATAAMPVLELPECRHTFHRACARQLADHGRPCPVCRQSVHWTSVDMRARPLLRNRSSTASSIGSDGSQTRTVPHRLIHAVAVRLGGAT